MTPVECLKQWQDPQHPPAWLGSWMQHHQEQDDAGEFLDWSMQTLESMPQVLKVWSRMTQGKREYLIHLLAAGKKYGHVWTPQVVDGIQVSND